MTCYFEILVQLFELHFCDGAFGWSTCWSLWLFVVSLCRMCSWYASLWWAPPPLKTSEPRCWSQLCVSLLWKWKSESVCLLLTQCLTEKHPLWLKTMLVFFNLLFCSKARTCPFSSVLMFKNGADSCWTFPFKASNITLAADKLHNIIRLCLQ